MAMTEFIKPQVAYSDTVCDQKSRAIALKACEFELTMPTAFFSRTRVHDGKTAVEKDGRL
jgi:hypothetical protein